MQNGHHLDIPIAFVYHGSTVFKNAENMYGAPRGFGDLGRMVMELASTGNYFRGAREPAYNFGDLGSLAKKQNK